MTVSFQGMKAKRTAERQLELMEDLFDHVRDPGREDQQRHAGGLAAPLEVSVAPPQCQRLAAGAPLTGPRERHRPLQLGAAKVSFDEGGVRFAVPFDHDRLLLRHRQVR